MKQKIVLGLISLTLAAGCKKDDNDNVPAGTIKYLQRHVTTENGADVTHTLGYDSKKRLVSYSSEEEEYQSKVTYDDQDRPIKFELGSEGDEQVITITYNASGVPVSAVMKTTLAEEPDVEKTTNITYETANGKVNKMIFIDEDESRAEFVLTYSGNNLTKAQAIGEEGQLIFTYKYGTKKSPFTGARFKYILLPDLFEYFYSENEIVETITDWVGVISFTTKTAYEYDAAGYPVSAKILDEDGDEVSSTKFYYN